MPEIELSQGTIQYRDEGSGPVVVLVHCMLVDASIWDPVVGLLAGHARCVVPDLPLGSHRRSMRPGADLSPPGVARLIVELLERLELSDVTLVGNDTGGALCQLVAAHHPERLDRLVLCDCDAFENFPPRSFAPAVQVLGRVPGALAAYALLARLRPVRRGLAAVMGLTARPIPDEIVRAWAAPLADAGVRADVTKLLRGISSDQTVQAAVQLRSFERPALIIWGTDDRFFPLRDGERLAATLPNARLEVIEGARTFVQLDAPARFADLVAGFASTPMATTATAPMVRDDRDPTDHSAQEDAVGSTPEPGRGVDFVGTPTDV
jgi:pimeloyl-ACP methyl ester carboxylesterase